MATLKIKDSNGNWQEVFALKGNTGPKGEDGKAPDITLEVTTLPAGSTATVTKSGTSENPIFRLGIPKGDKGDTPTGVVKLVNNESPDINGNVTITSVQRATQDANGNVINTTYATVASVNTVAQAANTAQTTANTANTAATNANTAANNRILKSGNRGTLSGYNTPASTGAAVTINNGSNDDTIVTAAVAVTIANGASGQTWIKTVALQNASATVSLSSSWKWVGGSAPTIKANSILVVKWCGTFGIANLVTGG